MDTPNSSGSEKMDVEPKEGRRSTPGESPLAGPHRAFDGIGRFADPDDLRALRVVSKQFNAHSRLPAAIKRCFEKRCRAERLEKGAVAARGRRGHGALFGRRRGRIFNENIKKETSCKRSEPLRPGGWPASRGEPLPKPKNAFPRPRVFVMMRSAAA